MSTEDFNDGEFAKILNSIEIANKKVGIEGDSSAALSAVCILIKTLINNGSLTSKQVQQTLKEIT